MSEIMRKVKELGNESQIITLLTDFILNEVEAKALYDAIKFGEEINPELLRQRRGINLLKYKGLIGKTSKYRPLKIRAKDLEKNNKTYKPKVQARTRGRKKQLKRLNI